MDVDKEYGTFADTVNREQFGAVLQKYCQNSDGASDLAEMLARVQPTIGMDGAIVLQWRGMWLCIERDGYTHS